MSPLISCVLPTYNRIADTSLVHEAVASFLCQTHQNKELIVVNDCPSQTLEYNHGRIKIINLDYRFPTLGEKLNYGFSFSQGDYLCRFDDDDISLPWRLSQSLAGLRKGASCWQQSAFWFVNSKEWRVERRQRYPAPSKSVFTREIFEKVGQFTRMNTGQDTDFEKKMVDAGVPPVREETKDDEVNYIYRWNTGSYHLSPLREGGYEKIGERPAETGTFWLQPHWRVDYVGQTRKRSKK